MRKTSLFIIFLLSVALAYPKDKTLVSSLTTRSKIIYDICFSERGGAIGIADNNTITIYDVTTGKLLREFGNGHHGRIMTLDISRDSTILASGGSDSIIVLRNLQSGEIRKTLKYHKGIITSLKISPDGHYLISGGTDGRIFLYDIEADKVVGEFKEHTDDITCVVFSPDSRLAAGAGADGSITVLDIKSAKTIGILKDHKGWIRGITFSRDGSRLLSCGDNSEIITWNLSDFNNISVFRQKENEKSWLLCIDYNDKQDAYTFGSLNGILKIRFSFGTYIRNLHVPVNRAKFRPGFTDTFEVAVATRGKGVMLINTKEMRYKK